MRIQLAIAACFGAALAALSARPASAQDCKSVPPGGPAVQITPVLLRPLLAEIVPVQATDNRIHLAYAAQLTNIATINARLDQIVPVDPLSGFQPTGRNVVEGFTGLNITGLVRPFRQPLIDGEPPKTPADGRFLDGGGAGTTFFDITYATATDVPRLVSHRLTVNYPKQTIIECTDPIPVSRAAPVVLSPPLRGPRWWDGDGCCEIVGPHRGATLGINGAIMAPEQFGIDYAQLTPSNTCCTGPVKKLSSWPFFGAPVLAAADGVVVDKLDGLPEQIPGKPVGVTAQNAAGNHITEDIGHGRYVLYAHLATGSIPRRITIGTRLKVGEQIGQVGNTGSTTAPHLHFQVMDRPSALNATGLPFVFDSQELEGQVAGSLIGSAEAYEAGSAVDYRPQAPMTRLNQMPAETQVFGYHLQSFSVR